MTLELIRTRLLDRPELAQWSAFVQLVNRPVREQALPCWEYPLLSARCEGASDDVAMAAATAVFAQLYGIHLIDDLLDQEPEGLQTRVSVGEVANLASAFQGAAGRELVESDLTGEEKASAVRWMSEMQIATCWGQHLDSLDATTEEAYWQIARAKTPPLFSFALAVGALFAGSGITRAQEYSRLGEILGLLVQVSDDLGDAIARPAAPDWNRYGSNLAILYARTVEHRQRQDFEQIASRVSISSELERAQRILVECGSVSFCVYKMIEFSRQARAMLAELAPPEPAELERLVDHLMRPLAGLLKRVGLKDPESLMAGIT